MAMGGGSHLQGHRAPRLFGRERPVHAALGGREAADIILWRRPKASASILGAATAAWALFEVAEYHFLTLACYAAMIAMLTFFIWTSASAFLNLPVPRIPETILSERTAKQVILGLHRRLTWFAHRLYAIACGEDIKKFIMTVVSIYIASVVATCFSSLTLLYLVVLCTMTVPALYERYEHEVEHLVATGARDVRTHLAKMDSGVLRKIPRGKGATTAAHGHGATANNVHGWHRSHVN
ncbi:reticulon-like protein B9 [Triticum dicoccoides]|uniref:reticulon-like protein B9 n=1 Tax=Triticum dicoccoides TaxID=85692 RepID=UPI0018903C09|nr:reticulon-like protein B9 [Triticum dicoccoides]